MHTTITIYDDSFIYKNQRYLKLAKQIKSEKFFEVPWHELKWGEILNFLSDGQNKYFDTSIDLHILRYLIGYCSPQHLLPTII